MTVAMTQRIRNVYITQKKKKKMIVIQLNTNYRDWLA